MGIRLNKVLTELNIGLQTTIDFLKAHKELGDISDDTTVNTKIGDKQYEALVNYFKGSIRLNKVLIELNIGLQIAVDFLKLHRELGDIRDDATPNTKISVAQYNALVKEFGSKTYPKTQSDISLFRKSEDKDVRILGKIDLSSIAKPIGNSGKKYDVFVSYSRLDTNRVQAIVGEIEKKGYRVWIDKKGIDSGDEFKTTIVKAIRNSEVFLFFSSKGANESTWTMKEVNTAVHFKKAIIPVKLDNTEYDDSILLELVGLDYVDFTIGSQHSYAISKLIKALQKKIRI
ncbi:toll/interleukin-1 receptor domain-containing protein [uncultured Prevotella sp.]|uniref:toll/interleukin-1 receptor domain-containing protein n=1 Tax=uncultured Prevotella sp. TaxID=159272 RepID=UPI0025F914C9|nr:toll/interleukin-1 receptor domain-containing protein [uncultured Prevotella sp.]